MAVARLPGEEGERAEMQGLCKLGGVHPRFQRDRQREPLTFRGGESWQVDGSLVWNGGDSCSSRAGNNRMTTEGAGGEGVGHRENETDVLWDLGLVSFPLWASVSSSSKWG